jgi:hypothetical protein
MPKQSRNNGRKTRKFSTLHLLFLHRLHKIKVQNTDNNKCNLNIVLQQASCWKCVLLRRICIFRRPKIPKNI